MMPEFLVRIYVDSDRSDIALRVSRATMDDAVRHANYLLEEYEGVGVDITPWEEA